MPEEIFFIILAAIVGGSTLTYSIVRMSLNYYRDKHGIGRGGSKTPSLTTSELHQIVQGAVEEAVHPLSDRLELIEKSLEPAETSRQLQSGEDELLENG